MIAGVFSCNKFLERPPQGQLTEEDALKDESSLLAFTNSMYTLLSDNDFLGGRVQIVSELLGDEYDGNRFTGDFGEIYNRRNSIFGDTKGNLYLKAYRIIASSNLSLRNLDKASAQRNTLEGQAKLFRAIVHFEMVRLFAQPYGFTPENNHPGVPLRLVASTDIGERATVKQVYDQVIADLKQADTLLPDANGNLATKWTAKGYLAKVYFQMNNFTEAYNYADQVIKSNKYQLDTAYADRFAIAKTKEALFKIVTQNSAFVPGGELRDQFRSDNKQPGFYFTPTYFSTATAAPTDKRIGAWYSSTLQSGFLVLTKYNKDFFDLPVLHYTEIKLIRAEAGAEIGASNATALATALTDINDILRRAYNGTRQIDPLAAGAALIISNTRAQRELEMVGEGNRIQEIKRIGVRNGISVDRRGSPWNCNGMILQFPKGEQDANASFILNPEGGCF